MTFDPEEVLQYRREKDEAFRRDKNSPIPVLERPYFAGLRYFSLDRSYYVPTKLTPPRESKRLTLTTSDGDERIYEVAGTFDFTVRTGTGQLTAYRQDAEDPDLFVPFRDATAPKETYGAGRYLDLPYRPDQFVFLDFNLAYNPYCAYSDDFSCPFPPRENWLPFPIPVGEKNYRDEGAAASVEDDA